MDKFYRKSSKTSFTLAELTSHLAKNAAVNANVAIVLDSSNLTFTESSTKGLYHALSKKLMMGTVEAHPGGAQRAWTHVHSRTNTEVEIIRNHVAYYSEDGIRRNNYTLMDLDLVEPFKVIENMTDARGPNKMRNLILFFFLAEGYVERGCFAIEGFGYFTRSCKDIANARNALQLLPSTSLTPSEVVPVPSSTLEDLNLEGVAEKPTDAKPSDTETKETYGQNITTSTPLKRARDYTESITNEARPTKRLHTEEGLYQLQEFDENAKLQAQGRERVKERDEWRSTALLGREQLLKANQERRETTEELASTKMQLEDLRTNCQKLLDELESSKKLLSGEVEARKESEQKRRMLQKELHQLRTDYDRSKAFGKQLLELAAKLSDDGSA